MRLGCHVLLLGMAFWKKKSPLLDECAKSLDKGSESGRLSRGAGGMTGLSVDDLCFQNSAV